MQTAVINVKVRSDIKKQAQKVAEELGLSLSAAINGFLRHFVKTKTVTFGIEEEPSEWMIHELAKSKKNIEKGLVSPAFDNAEDAIAWLHDPKRKYANQIRKKV